MSLRPVTLKDIANELRVSIVTVSKALREHPDISKQTMERVKKTAREMGYHPNYLARNLSSRKTRTIGLVIPKIAHFFFGSVIEAVYDTAFRHNYEIILTVSQENADREKIHIQTLISMQVDGIIISITEKTKDYIIFHEIKKLGIPLVFVDRFPNVPGISTVSVDDRGGAFLAVEQAIRVGYQNIGHIGGYSGINIGDHRYLGFVDAMEKYHIPIKSEWVIRGGFGKEDGYRAFMKLFKSGNLPNFIFTVTYPVALGVYRAAHEVGIRIPEDLDIICFGDSDIHQFIYPPLSCVNQPTEDLGIKAVELMLQYIEDPDNIKEQHIVLPTDLILRGTCTQLRRKNLKTYLSEV